MLGYFLFAYKTCVGLVQKLIIRNTIPMIPQYSSSAVSCARKNDQNAKHHLASLSTTYIKQEYGSFANLLNDAQFESSPVYTFHTNCNP